MKLKTLNDLENENLDKQRKTGIDPARLPEPEAG